VTSGLTDIAIWLGTLYIAATPPRSGGSAGPAGEDWRSGSPIR